MLSGTRIDLRATNVNVFNRVQNALRLADSARERIDVILSWKLSKDVRKDLLEIRELLRDATHCPSWEQST